MNARIHNRFLCGALALLGATAALAPAEAAVYRGRFDPVYGAPFTTPALAWAGTLEVAVDDSCVNPGTVTLLLDCPIGGFQINEAKVFLYTAGDPVDADGFPLPGSIKQTLDFGSAAGPAISGLGWQLTFDGSEDLTGAMSTAFPALQGAIDETRLNESPFSTTSTAQAYFSLQFLGQYAQLYWFQNEPSALELLALTAGYQDEGFCRENGVVRIRPIWLIGYSGNRCGWSDPENIDELGAFITFERVPEPATHTLVPAALALMGVAGMVSRRRRSSKSEA
ncbi:MAG: hypothetical protein J0L57_00835 [Burkholderiales bacterium]|nr:hypothetical protein [Burkholderiales bacterium]